MNWDEDRKGMIVSAHCLSEGFDVTAMIQSKLRQPAGQQWPNQASADMLHIWLVTQMGGFHSDFLKHRRMFGCAFLSVEARMVHTRTKGHAEFIRHARNPHIE